VGVGLGIAAWFALPHASAWTGFLCAALAVALGAGAAAWGSRWGRAIAIFGLAAGFGCGVVWMKAERAAAPKLERARMAEFNARIETVQKLPAREAVRLLVAPIEADLPPKLRINVDEKMASSALQVGATVRLKAWLMPPAPMAVPGAFDFAQYAWFQGIGGSGRASKVELVEPASEQGWRARLSSTRQRLADHVRSRLPEGEGAVAAALATGDQGAIPEADAEAMRASGLAHLLSVSGLHLTAAVGAVMLLTLKLLALSPTLALRLPLVLIAAGAGAFAGIAYTLLTGAEVPTIRACVAALLVLLALALGRDALTLRLGRGRGADRARLLAGIARWRELPAELRGDHRDRGPARTSAHQGAPGPPRGRHDPEDRPGLARAHPDGAGRRSRPDADRALPFSQGRILRSARKRHCYPTDNIRCHAA
jgi:competence protein ComEC